MYMIIMVTPIDLTDINSVEDAKNALQTWNISKEKAEYITQALLWMEWLLPPHIKLLILY